MLFKLISDGKHTVMELDGKTLGSNVTKIAFIHDARGSKNDEGGAELSLTFDLGTVYSSEQTGNSYGVADEDGRFDECVKRYEQNQMELYETYSSTKEQRDAVRKALQDETRHTQ